MTKAMARGLIVVLALIGLGFAVPDLAHASGGGSSEPKVPTGPVYIAMDPITVPVIRNGKVRGQLVLGVNLVADGPKAAGIERKLPRLHDAYVKFLLRYGSPGPNGKFAFRKIKARLQSIADKTFGAGEVVVLIRGIVPR